MIIVGAVQAITVVNLLDVSMVATSAEAEQLVFVMARVICDAEFYMCISR